MRRALFLLYLAGCRGLYGVDGEHDAAPARDGPAHDAPRDGASDARVDAPAQTPIVPWRSKEDNDNDGVFNDVDLCPNINDKQHPESDDDADGDGVGDSCDPHPNDPAHPDCIVLADGFGTQLDQHWNVDGSWPYVDQSCASINGHGLCGMVSGASPRAFLSFNRPLDAEVVELEAYVVTTDGSETAAFVLGAQLGGVTDLTGRGCGIFKDTNGNQMLGLLDLDAGSGTIDVSTAFAGAFQNFAYRPMRMDVDHTCKVADMGQPYAAPASVPPDATVGIAVSSTGAFLTGVVAYSQNCPARAGSAAAGQ